LRREKILENREDFLRKVIVGISPDGGLGGSRVVRSWGAGS
jgi:hypothetical protein